MKSLRRAFTLIEIMIVVLIIGILLAIAVPNFVRAREVSRAKSCVANLRTIDSAKEQWAMDNKAIPGADAPDLTGLVGSANYIRTEPLCPSNGTYDTTTVGSNPTCSVGGTAPTDPLAHDLPG